MKQHEITKLIGQMITLLKTMRQQIEENPEMMDTIIGKSIADEVIYLSKKIKDHEAKH